MQQQHLTKQQQLKPNHNLYDKLNRQQLIQQLQLLKKQNSRLKNRLNDHQPYKQKILRMTNQDKLRGLFQKYQKKRFALKVCYLGFNYDGMACQAEKDNSVQEFIFKTMHTLSLIPRAFPSDQSFTRAGRTDKGVSAMGNVISLHLRTNIQKKLQQQNQNDTKTNPNPLNYCNMMNSILPQDIRIIGCQQVPQDFNARYCCTSRRYKYFFAKNNLNIQLMKKTIKQYVGTHNFINFCKINVTNTINFQRTIFSADIIQVQRDETLQEQDDRNKIYYFYFIGNSFLWHQIRFMSNIMFMIGLGQEPPTIIKDLFDLQKYPRKPNYAMAPQYPLILEDCQYQNLKFQNTDPNIIYNFYNTFNDMIMKKSVEKVMIINCMILARQSLVINGKISDQAFRNAVLEKSKHVHKGKSMNLHKSSGRGLQEAINGLKGKKLDLYLKKAQKQAKYQQRIKQQKQQKQKHHNESLQQDKQPKQ